MIAEDDLPLLQRLEILERRSHAQEQRLVALERRRKATLDNYAARDQSISRVLAGASAKMKRKGHRWILKRGSAAVLCGYTWGLAAAVAFAEGDVSRQVRRATYVMQRAAAEIDGMPIDAWVLQNGRAL